VLDILVQARRNASAAKRFFRRLLNGLQYEPRVIVTDKLWSYGVAKRELLPSAEHRQSCYLRGHFGITAERPSGGGWMAGRDVIPSRYSKPCWKPTPHVDPDHPRAA